jgi:hypothetical protein
MIPEPGFDLTESIAVPDNEKAVSQEIFNYPHSKEAVSKEAVSEEAVSEEAMSKEFYSL